MPTLRGTPTVGHVASGTLTVNVPTGVVSGDVIIIEIIVNGASNVPATPSGLTALASYTVGPSTAYYAKISDGTETSFAFTVASDASYTCRVYSGVDSTTASIVIGTPNRVASSTTATATSITTVVDGCKLVFCSGTANNSAQTFTNPSGFGNQAITTGSGRTTVSADEDQTTAGATGSLSGTWTGAGSNNVSVLIAIAPSGAKQVSGSISAISTVSGAARRVKFVAGSIGATSIVSGAVGRRRPISSGVVSATTVVSGAIRRGAPSNTVAPSISGSPIVGQVLTATDGTWT